jgi:hypothetical protein
MIDVSEFASPVMRRFELAGSAEGLHLRLVAGEAHDLVRHSFGGREAKPEGAAE